MEKNIESYIYLINFLLPILSSHEGDDPQNQTFNLADEQKYANIRNIFLNISASLKTAADKSVTDIHEVPDGENFEYYQFVSKILDVAPYNT